MVFVFFGHRNAPASVKPVLKEKIRVLMKHEENPLFYVGNHGNFDAYVRSVLEELGAVFYIVLAYLPGKEYEGVNTVYPEGLETVPPKFAILYRNRWMVDQADCIISYITHDWGGAAQAVKYGERRKKSITNIADL